MIVGITHDKQTLAPRSVLAVAYKVAIGIPAKSPGNDTNHPKKLDHFLIESKAKDGEWREDGDLSNLLRQKHSRRIPAEGDKPERVGPLREFDVVFMSDNIDDIFKTEMSWWSRSERKCSGDGRTAMRSQAILPKDFKVPEEFKGQRSVPWTPCGEECPQYRQECKPSGQLYFMFADRPTIGSVAAYFTTSAKSIIQIQSSLEQIRAITGGRLRGIRLKMVLRPGKTRYKDPQGVARTGQAFFVHIEFRAEDHAQMVSALLEQSVQYERARLQTADIRNVTPASRQLEAPRPTPSPAMIPVDETDVIEELPEEEQAEIMGGEFYPEATGDEPEDDPDESADGAEASGQAQDQGTGQPAAPARHLPPDIAQISALCSVIGVNDARKEALCRHYKGDIDAVVAYLKNLKKGLDKAKATPEEVQEYLQRGAHQPDWLLQFVNGLAPKAPAGPAKKRQSKKKEDAPAQPGLAEQPAPAATSGPPVDDAPDPTDTDNSKWNF